MEQSFTSDALTPQLIFGGLSGEIMDYIISSYRVNLALIHLYYYKPQLQVHCQEAFNGSGKEDFVYTHKVDEPGIYHAKFILLTTKDVLKLIVMTTNITESTVKNCLNDYYVIMLPKTKLASPTVFTTYFYQFLDTYGIKLQNGLLQYDWRGIKGKLLVSIPGKLSHGMCFTSQVKAPKKNSKTKATIRCASMMTGYDIRKLFHVKECILEYLKDNPHGTAFGLYDLEHNVEKDKKQRYTLVPFESATPFHYKRYTIEYQGKERTRRYLIITSANLTRQAWGTAKYAASNAELGIIWNSKFTFN